MTTESESKPTPKKRALRHQIHHWLRWLHTYVSMLCLLVVLFFSVTGITLNHPEWTFGGVEVRREASGTLSADCVADGKVDWLRVVEEIRKEQPVHGSAVETRVDGDQGSFAFKAPGYTADTFFDLKSREYQISMNNQGALGVLNDLHRGRDSGKVWAWLIDISGVFLLVVSLTGLGILFYLKKVRLKGFVTGIAGCALLIVLAWLASK